MTVHGVRLRIDQLLLERGLFESRARAHQAIAAGLVRADGILIDKASRSVSIDARIEAEAPFETVSRAGLKLKAALFAFKIDPRGRICLDIGASTGGFSDLLRQRGAARVYAVDVGHGQLHPKLRADPRIVALEGTDARVIDAALVPDMVSLIVADLSFIGLAKALPAGLGRLAAGGDLIVLIKPQFEAGPKAGKRGIIRDAGIHDAVCTKVGAELAAMGITAQGLIPSPIDGGDGNREFLFYGRKAPV